MNPKTMIEKRFSLDTSVLPQQYSRRPTPVVPNGVYPLFRCTRHLAQLQIVSMWQVRRLDYLPYGTINYLWKFFRTVAYMQNNFRITRLKHLEIRAELIQNPRQQVNPLYYVQRGNANRPAFFTSTDAGG